MTIRTASIRDIKKLPKSAYKIIAMRYFPYWMKGIKDLYDEWLPILSPNKQLLSDFNHELKRIKDPRLAWNLTKYDMRFRYQILHNTKALGELKRIREMGRRLRGRRVVYLICHEPTDDYCHRRILKELMEKYEL